MAKKADISDKGIKDLAASLALIGMHETAATLRALLRDRSQWRRAATQRAEAADVSRALLRQALRGGPFVPWKAEEG